MAAENTSSFCYTSVPLGSSGELRRLKIPGGTQMGRFFRVSIGYTLLGHHNSPQYRKSSISSVEKPSASQVSTKVLS